MYNPKSSGGELFSVSTTVPQWSHLNLGVGYSLLRGRKSVIMRTFPLSFFTRPNDLTQYLVLATSVAERGRTAPSSSYSRKVLVRSGATRRWLGAGIPDKGNLMPFLMAVSNAWSAVKSSHSLNAA